MIADDEIDRVLLANITKHWRKVALVVGLGMMQIDKERRKGKDDTYFAERVANPARKGLIEHKVI